MIKLKSYKCNSCNHESRGGYQDDGYGDYYCADCWEIYYKQNYTNVYRCALSAICISWKTTDGEVIPLHCDFLEKYCDKIDVESTSIIAERSNLHQNQLVLMEVLQIPSINKVYAINVTDPNCDDIGDELKKKIIRDGSWMIENCSNGEIKRVCKKFIIKEFQQIENEIPSDVINICLLLLLNNKHRININPTQLSPISIKNYSLQHLSLIDKNNPQLISDLTVSKLSSTNEYSLLSVQMATHCTLSKNLPNVVYHPIKLVKYNNDVNEEKVSYKQIKSGAENTIKLAKNDKIEIIFIAHDGLCVVEKKAKRKEKNESFEQLINALQERHEKMGNIVFKKTVRTPPFTPGDPRNKLCRYCFMEEWTEQHQQNCLFIPEWIRNGYPKPPFENIKYQKIEPLNIPTKHEPICIFVKFDDEEGDNAKKIKKIISFYYFTDQPLRQLMESWCEKNNLPKEFYKNLIWMYRKTRKLNHYDTANEIRLLLDEAVTNTKNLPQDTIVVKF